MAPVSVTGAVVTILSTEGGIMNTMTAHDVQTAREWLLDCADSFADDAESFEDTVTTLSPDGIARAIDRYYDGGVAGFLQDGAVWVES